MTIYFDHNATTPIDPRVLMAMEPYLRGAYGNASSIHRLGRLSRAAVERAREQVAALLGAHPEQVVFTSGGTEANNAALKGVAAATPGGTVLVSAIEHASVLETAAGLGPFGWQHELLPVSDDGRVKPETLAAALTPAVRLVSVMWANNETGVVHDLPQLAQSAKAAGALFHTDAVQAAGKIPVDFAASGADLLSISGHKLYGPKGVGALLVGRNVVLTPLVHGSTQEKGRRGGTENVAGIVGLGTAAEIAAREMAERAVRLKALRERLEAQLAERLPEAVVFAQHTERLANTVFLAIPGVDGETLLMNMDRRDIALSAGAACAGAREPSHVLRAMGVEHELARGAVRVSLGHDNNEADVDALVTALVTERDALRASAWV
ncbi:MAG: cysteine desulfurase family protein [Thiohalomonadaceae bacterium]